MWEGAWAVVTIGNEYGQRLAGVVRDLGRNFFRLVTEDGEVLVPMSCCWEVHCS